jgi:putative ABC transport system substrate-binding protein
MRRREFITLISGAAVAWPLALRAQQIERVRRVGILMNLAEGDPESQIRVGAFRQALQKLGWSEGHNLQIDTRWGAGNPDHYRSYATELVALTPDVILAADIPSVQALQQTTRDVPIVFVTISEPVGAGLVTSLSRPRGNTTGFMQFDYNISAKWLELLREISPSISRAAVFQDPTNIGSIGLLGAITSAAYLLRVEIHPIDLRDPHEVEGAVAAFASEPNGGLILLASTLAAVRRELIIRLAAQYRVPAIYPYRYLINAGGLIGYGPDLLDQFRRAASYVDRIFKGESPTGLPVQAPTKYELAINLKTAKALGLTVPPSLLARADEVIE